MLSAVQKSLTVLVTVLLVFATNMGTNQAFFRMMEETPARMLVEDHIQLASSSKCNLFKASRRLSEKPFIDKDVRRLSEPVRLQTAWLRVSPYKPDMVFRDRWTRGPPVRSA